MLRHSLTIARFTLLEGLRARFFRVAGLALLLVLAASLFAGQLSLTESQRIQATLLAAMLRPASVFLLSLYIIGSITREFNDKGVDLLLAADLPRASYVAGKLAGFTLLGALLALATGLLAALFAPLLPTVQWSISLLFELWLISAFSLFCAISFSQVLPATSLVLGFYLLARNITTIQLLENSPVLEHGLSQQAISTLIDLISLTLPRLEHFTQSAWLAGYPAGWGALLPLLAQSLLYITLLTAATMFDFYRKNF